MIHLVWEDQTEAPGWMDYDMMDMVIKDLKKSSQIISVGWLLKETDEAYFITNSMSLDQFNSPMMILKRNVVSKKFLEVGT